MTFAGSGIQGSISMDNLGDSTIINLLTSGAVVDETWASLVLFDNQILACVFAELAVSVAPPVRSDLSLSRLYLFVCTPVGGQAVSARENVRPH